ncbi:ATP-dependent DNA helicase [Corynebacterium phocae]|uniref:ATP-dependent DNA helicase n=1 Tax=Corynebacterium phocae TaxID=161895 RepID=A0A1L7D3D4_9CORY|nr:ATP-dependent DNA helicase RecG [Corynebacterium phocae]APT92620.1 ATP-dependent DNA helicase [Corynebacterium phocae]KAA8724177.1 ATP-dependent DNA helicase RecG [Corynebacterium phocae]
MLGWRDERPLKEVLPDKAATLLSKQLGCNTVGDLLAHYPRDYVRHGQDVNFHGAEEGDVVTVSGIVDMSNLRVTKRGQEISVVRLDTGLEASFFGQPWVARIVAPGSHIMLSGKLKFFNGQPQLASPTFALLGGEAAKMAASPQLKQLAQFGSLEELLGDRPWIPIYPATAKVSSWFIMGAIHHVLTQLEHIPEPLDYELPISYDQALRAVHEPGPDGPYLGIHRLKYNEALTVGLVMALRRRDAQAQNAPAMEEVSGGFRESAIAALPFELTQGQQDVVQEISADISRSFPMQRLLQGEVGSGKTMVAVLAMLQAIDAGYQAALLAPTEVLAGQHAASIGGFVPQGVKVVLLTGSMKTAQKRQALLDIVSGEADIVIGTHAIIQDAVEFFNLGMVIVDEQHRFGVEQRDRLRSKTRDGTHPHTLVMTATPIPRTVAMTVFGDLAVSTLRELPGGRKPIESFIVPDSQPAWVERGWQRIREEVSAGRQAYVVCPRIDAEGGVEEVAAELSNGPLADTRITCLHGRMADRDEIMASFARGESDVMVATTVIEVGVDVPNATVMLIREAEKFGVSQLHQLRGRVGRGGNASLCLLHTSAQPGSASFERIEKVAATPSGFELADLDLATRKEGDILGTVQSGTKKTLRLLNLLRDRETIERAEHDAAALVERDPGLAQALVGEFSEQEREYLEKN